MGKNFFLISGYSKVLENQQDITIFDEINLAHFKVPKNSLIVGNFIPVDFYYQMTGSGLF